MFVFICTGTFNCKYFSQQFSNLIWFAVGRWRNCAGPKGRWKNNLISKIAKAGVAFDNAGVSPVVRLEA
jgi:hypothetical protein